MTALPIGSILPNSQQPRQDFNNIELQALADSIRIEGLIQAITVEDLGDGTYMLVDGERRLRACKLLNLTTIEAYIRPLSDNVRLGIDAVIANLQRADLNPIEEAQAYDRMIRDYGMQRVEITRRVGVSYPTVTNRLMLLTLEPEIQALIATRRLSLDVRMVEAISSIPSSDLRVITAKQIAAKGLSIKAAVNACQRVVRKVRDGDHAEQHPESPISLKLAHKRKVLPPMRWNAALEADLVPSWETVEKAASITCRKCAYAKQASSEICSSCPVVEMLVQLEECVP